VPKGSIRINSGRLRELRTAAALSHQSLAAVTGLTRQTTTRVEATGIAMPSTLEKIAHALNVTASDLQ